jgi:hypothetical protein
LQGFHCVPLFIIGDSVFNVAVDARPQQRGLRASFDLLSSRDIGSCFVRTSFANTEHLVILLPIFARLLLPHRNIIEELAVEDRIGLELGWHAVHIF